MSWGVAEDPEEDAWDVGCRKQLVALVLQETASFLSSPGKTETENQTAETKKQLEMESLGKVVFCLLAMKICFIGSKPLLGEGNGNGVKVYDQPRCLQRRTA